MPDLDVGLRRLLLRSSTVTSAARLAKVISRRARMPVHDPDFRALYELQIAGRDVLDIGANVGQSALSILAIEPTARVTSIEPNPGCYAALDLTKALLGGRLRVIKAGVGDKPGELPFYVPVRSGRQLLEEGTFDRAALETDAARARNGATGGIQIMNLPVITIDSLGAAPAFVKIDVQGFEAAVLRGMQGTIAAHRPAIMLERGVSDSACHALLTAHGYVRRYWQARWSDAAHPGAVNVFYLPG